MLDVRLMVDLVPDSIYLRSGRPAQAVALVAPGDAPQVTYGRLSDRAARIAAGLASLRIGHGDRVALLGRNPLTTLDIMLGCARAGAVLVYLDDHLSEMDLSLVAADASPSILFYEHAFLTEAWLVADSSDCILVALDEHNGDRPHFERFLVADPVLPVPVSLDHPWIITYRDSLHGPPGQTILTHGAVLEDAVRTCLSWARTGSYDSPPVLQPLFHGTDFDVCTLAHLLYGP